MGLGTKGLGGADVSGGLAAEGDAVADASVSWAAGLMLWNTGRGGLYTYQDKQAKDVQEDCRGMFIHSLQMCGFTVVLASDRLGSGPCVGIIF